MVDEKRPTQPEPAESQPDVEPSAGSPAHNGGEDAPMGEPKPVGEPKPAGEPGPTDESKWMDPLEDRVIQVLRTVYDPEIPVNIHELGLIYEVDVQPSGEVKVVMTLTSPSCPAAQSLPEEVKQRVTAVSGVRDAKVDVTWDPPWGPERMTQAARLQLGLD